MSSCESKERTSHVIPDWESHCHELEAELEATEHALEFAHKRMEKISAERIKEIEAHRQTTLKLVALQEKQR
jgi:hypothetical protein